VLAPGGVLALGYRDDSGPPRTCVDRFIPVHHDERSAMLCCVEVLDADRASVTDIVTTAKPGGLRTQIGAYSKPRLAPASVAVWALAAGFALDREATEHGMLLQVFRAHGVIRGARRPATPGPLHRGHRP
jgi:hypothetical protein